MGFFKKVSLLLSFGMIFVCFYLQTDDQIPVGMIRRVRGAMIQRVILSPEDDGVNREVDITEDGTDHRFTLPSSGLKNMQFLGKGARNAIERLLKGKVIAVDVEINKRYIDVVVRCKDEEGRPYLLCIELKLHAAVHGQTDMKQLTDENLVQIRAQFDAIWDSEYCQKKRYYVLQVEEKGLSGEYAVTRLIIGRLFSSYPFLI
jgi:hypothetical protein